MADDIGSYYESKRQKQQEAMERVHEHRRECGQCRELPSRCPIWRVLMQRALDAGYTGD
jgi:hypothetical protein